MSLEVVGLSKRYGGVQALAGISLSVAPGECVALIGPNGAGKSTAFACIAGQTQPSAGQIRWRGERLEPLAPAQRLRAGVARTFQVAQNFEALTVLQNLELLVQRPQGLPAWKAWAPLTRERALERLAQVGLEDLHDRLAASLPYGARKRLELALALCGLPADQAGLLLLDEPAAGLAAPERAQTMQRIRSLSRSSPGQPGCAVLYTEHNMDAVFGLADRVVVLVRGQIVAQGHPDDVARDPLVQAAYLGHSAAVAQAQ